MHQPASFLRSWRKKDRPQTSPMHGSIPPADISPRSSSSSSPGPARIYSQRHPSDTPSESSTRLRRFFKGAHSDADSSSLASADETSQKEGDGSIRIATSFLPSQHSPPFRRARPPLIPDQSPLASPLFPDRSLPPTPPVRPPRPPSLNLDALEFPTTLILSPTTSKSPGSRTPPHLLRPKSAGARKMPELDDIWEGFIKDIEGETEDVDEFIFSARRLPSSDLISNVHSWTVVSTTSPLLVSERSPQAAQAALDHSHRSRPQPHSLYRATRSTPQLPNTKSGAQPPIPSTESDLEPSSEDELGSNVGFSLSLFPTPPPLTWRKRGAPKPLVLLPTPTIAPLPPSPSASSSMDSTPIATPTTPRSAAPSFHSARKSNSPASILKKPGVQSTHSPIHTAPALIQYPGLREDASSSSRITVPRLRSAQSVPYLQAPLSSNAHRNTSSDSTSYNTRQRVLSRPNMGPRPQQYSKALPATPGVEWGYAV
ncbi:hypothetical protein B0H10DRAFT_22410 [Mycena sp. CBHHK59/15]|nr:hypothetical protein B0H10DRAFT_22410 [Mycena sp. CBHHK59/15]